MITPLDDRVVVRQPDAPEEQITKSGIVIPQAAIDRPLVVDVVAVGPGKRSASGRLPMSLSVGDRVQIGRWSGTEIEIDGVGYLMLRESEILAVIEETEA